MATQSSKPNFLFIMADQLRHDYLGCAGTDWIHTPNIDRLAARGVRFTQACANAPVCAPARISLATGVAPHRSGRLTNSDFLPRRQPTYYQQLRDHGYVVGCVGKVDLAKPDHFNGSRGDRPVMFTYGFTHPVEIEGKLHAGTSPEPLGPYGTYLASKGKYQAFYEDYRRRASNKKTAMSDTSILDAEDFADSFIGRRSCEWLEANTSEFPWHLFVSFVGPHDPYDPPAEYSARCRNRQVPDPLGVGRISDKPCWHADRRKGFTAEQITQARRQYIAAMELIDDQIGQIIETLERTGQAENTCIVFASDHGDMLGDHDMSHKTIFFESALRVPLIACGPGIASGAVSDTCVELSDIGPTLCELAGVPVLTDIDAKSFVPTLRDPAVSHRTSTLASLAAGRCVRTPRHKLVLNQNDVTELYDLEQDPGEQHNLASERRELLSEMKSLCGSRLKEGQWLR